MINHIRVFLLRLSPPFFANGRCTLRGSSNFFVHIQLKCNEFFLLPTFIMHYFSLEKLEALKSSKFTLIAKKLVFSCSLFTSNITYAWKHKVKLIKTLKINAFKNFNHIFFFCIVFPRRTLLEKNRKYVNKNIRCDILGVE